MALTIRAQKLSNYVFKKINSVFRLKFNSKYYLISCHENLPIYSIEIDSIPINPSDIIVDSKWNDILILQDRAIFCKSFEKVKQSIMTNPTECIIGGSKQNSKYVLEGIVYRNFGDVPNYPRIIYYKINLGIRKFDNQIKIGDPVISINNDTEELIGMVTDITNNIVYVIPVYYIMKTILGHDNEILMPDIDNISQITKIDNNKISNGFIWNSHIRMNIPLDVHFLLEGDVKQEFELDNKITDVGFKKYSYNQILVNDSKVVEIDDHFLLTTRTFKFLSTLDRSFCRDFLDAIRSRKENVSSIKFKIERNGTLIVI